MTIQDLIDVLLGVDPLLPVVVEDGSSDEGLAVVTATNLVSGDADLLNGGELYANIKTMTDTNGVTKEVLLFGIENYERAETHRLDFGIGQVDYYNPEYGEWIKGSKEQLATVKPNNDQQKAKLDEQIKELQAKRAKL